MPQPCKRLFSWMSSLAGSRRGRNRDCCCWAMPPIRLSPIGGQGLKRRAPRRSRRGKPSMPRTGRWEERPGDHRRGPHSEWHKNGCRKIVALQEHQDKQAKLFLQPRLGQPSGHSLSSPSRTQRTHAISHGRRALESVPARHRPGAPHCVTWRAQASWHSHPLRRGRSRRCVATSSRCPVPRGAARFACGCCWTAARSRSSAAGRPRGGFPRRATGTEHGRGGVDRAAQKTGAAFDPPNRTTWSCF